jgi:hypothetical protein
VLNYVDTRNIFEYVFILKITRTVVDTTVRVKKILTVTMKWFVLLNICDTQYYNIFLSIF